MAGLGRRSSKTFDLDVDFEAAGGDDVVGRLSSEAASSYVESLNSIASRPPDAVESPPPVAKPAEEEEEEEEEAEDKDLPPMEAPCWVDPQEDLVQWLYHHKMYNFMDPFANLTALWLETGAKGLEEPEEEEEGGDLSPEEAAKKKAEKAKPKPDPVAEAKMENMRQQREKSQGLLVWQRGRDLRAELVDQFERRRSLALSSSASTASAASKGFRGMSSLDSEMGLHWYVAPRQPKNADTKTGAPRDRKKKTGRRWCWRSDFVGEVLHVALAMGMDRPVLDAFAVARAVRNDAEVALALREHVAVMSTDRQCQLWSPAFLQSLNVCYEHWKYDDKVRCEEIELMANHPEAMKLFASVKQAGHPPGHETRVRLPERLLRKRGEPPPLVMPDRLPTRMAYKSTDMGLKRAGSLTSLDIFTGGFTRQSSKASLASSARAGFLNAGRMAMKSGTASQNAALFGAGRPGLHRGMSVGSLQSSVQSRTSAKRVSFSQESAVALGAAA